MPASRRLFSGTLIAAVTPTAPVTVRIAPAGSHAEPGRDRGRGALFAGGDGAAVHRAGGVPPMTYLTEWRLSCAADMLTRTDATLEAIARDVGYSSPFALSAAFKRVRGVAPRTLRARSARP